MMPKKDELSSLLFDFHQQFNSYFDDFQNGAMTENEWQKVRANLVKNSGLIPRSLIEEVIPDVYIKPREEFLDEANYMQMRGYKQACDDIRQKLLGE